MIIDGKQTHWSTPFSGHRVSIVAFYHGSTSLLSIADQRKLRSLGFNFQVSAPSVGCASTSATPATLAGTLGQGPLGPAQAIHNRAKPYNRRLVEFCCGRNSRLGRPFPWNSGCETIRLTMDEDVTTERGLNFAINAVSDTSLPVLLWISIPCTGGCSWKHVNKGRGKSTRKLLAKRIRDFRLIWASALHVMEAAAKNGCTICIEWPRSCDYWKRREVMRALRQFGLESTIFHGCMYGLVSSMKSTKGRPINKAWRVATNNRGMMKGLRQEM